MPTLPIIPPSVPEGFCNTLGPDWVHQIINLMGQAVAVFTDVGTIILSQEDQPNESQRNFLWHKPSTGIIYKWSTGAGAWLAPNRELPLSDERRWWAGDLVNLPNYDGGNTMPLGINSGPMWEEDTEFVGRSPMHPGAIPDANPAKTLAVGENYGEGSHTMTAQEVGPHTHPLNADSSIVNGANIKVVNSGSGSTGLMIGLTGPASTDLSVLNNTYIASQQKMPVLHPVRGLYAIKRTIRANYVGS